MEDLPDVEEDEEEGTHVDYHYVPDLQRSASEEELLAQRLAEQFGVRAEQLRNPGPQQEPNGPDDMDEDLPQAAPPDHLTAPSLGSVINEFNTEGFLSMAFPNLLLDGSADLRDQTRRDHALKPAEYFKHLLRFHDSRFALDVRFLFFAFNCKMRWALLEDARLFLRKNPRIQNLTASELREELRDPVKGPRLAKKISRFASSLPGLAPYWHQQRSNLLAIIDQLGTPTLFFTLSAADTQWSDLHQLIEQYRALALNVPPRDLSALPEAEAKRIRNANLIDYPHIAAHFLEERFRAMLGTVFQDDPEFEAVDHWARFEWQFRGSGHIHGFLWIKGAPNVDDFDLENAQDRSDLEDFFDKLIWAGIPVPSVEVNPNYINLNGVLNRVIPRCRLSIPSQRPDRTPPTILGSSWTLLSSDKQCRDLTVTTTIAKDETKRLVRPSAGFDFPRRSETEPSSNRMNTANGTSPSSEVPRISSTTNTALGFFRFGEQISISPQFLAVLPSSTTSPSMRPRPRLLLSSSTNLCSIPPGIQTTPIQLFQSSQSVSWLFRSNEISLPKKHRISSIAFLWSTPHELSLSSIFMKMLGVNSF